MRKISILLRLWLRPSRAPGRPDPMAGLSLREWADLPPYHAAADAACR